MSSHQDDNLLPAKVPPQLGTIFAVLVTAVLIGMVIAAVVGGVNWLIGIGGGGTAIGTLGLAYFTFTVAERTTELADSSQRLETAAGQELSAAGQQAQAAGATAREAQKSRIDALAPILDFKVEFEIARVETIELTPVRPPTTMQLGPGNAPGPGQGHSDPGRLRFSAKLGLALTNFGRTPAFAVMKHVGAAFDGSGHVLRVDPDRTVNFTATLGYIGPADDPFSPREVLYEIEVSGALTRETVDRLTWRADLTLLERTPPPVGWRVHYDPLRVSEYVVRREHGVGG